MNIKIALPGNKYFSVPIDAIEKYAVSKDDFLKAVENEESIFGGADVVGQDDEDGRRRSCAMGIRG